MHDRHVRYPHDPGPIVPGQNELRYTILGRNDPDVIRIRQDVPEHGRGLFVAALGDTGVKALVEAYYPEDIRPAYYKMHLDKYRKAEFEQGRLVVISELFKWIGEIDPRTILEVNRNARNARAELKRAYDMDAHQAGMMQAEEDSTAETRQRWEDFYADAFKESVKFGMGKPRKSAYTPRGSR